jgi:plastocyanin
VWREKQEEEVTLMRRIVLLATMAVLVLVSTAFVVSVAGAHNQPAAKAHKQPKAGPAAASSRHPTRMVVIQGFRFRPAHITVKRGTRVRWVNKDRDTHTVTANQAGSFDSGHLRHGQSYSHTFKSAGKKGYHCEIHPFMRGSVLVKR